MSPSTTLYRFRIDLSDIERGVYDQLDFRIAQHPSETETYMLTRMLAFCLNWQDGLSFSTTGLSDPEGPAIFVAHPNGRTQLWIEIGNPTPKKIHKATKASAQVKIYTYKNPELLLQETANKEIFKASEVEMFWIDPHFLERLAKNLSREVRWSLLYNERVLDIGSGAKNEQTELKRFQLQK